MKLRVRNGEFEPASLFKFVFIGTLLGEGIIFIPFFAIVLGTGAISGMPVQGSPEMLWMFPIMVPVIIVMHALMFGGMITLGLWLYTRRGKLEILDQS